MITFKEYTQLIALNEIENDDEFLAQLEEGHIWDKIKSATKTAVGLVKSDDKKIGELEAMLSDKNPNVVRAAQRALDIHAKKGNAKAAELTARSKKDAKQRDSSRESAWQQKRSEVEADERGSSRAYDKETGTARRGEVRWDRETNQWSRG